MTSPRAIPSIDRLLQRPALAEAAGRHGREATADAVRAAAADLRTDLMETPGTGPSDVDAIGAAIEAAALRRLGERLASSLVPSINATGVLLHTNLGRAPLAIDALRRVQDIGRGYSNLEFDLAAGRRGHRHAHAERLLTTLTGAEAAVVTNNNAAAMLLTLAALASGREVIVSRGELVEIGGGFRVPEVLAQSGAMLREVGTTNRTRLSDYAAAISPRTALLLRVHRSNFRLEGFTERPELADLAGLAHRFDLPLVEDLGSGWLGLPDVDVPALAGEPTVRSSIAVGVDLVAFSGDKLLGGPQAGLVVGRRALVDRVRPHPLMRAVRADKLTYAALESTLALWAEPVSRVRLPIYRMLQVTPDAIAERARVMVAALTDSPHLDAALIDGQSTIGGGSAPGVTLPTTLVALRPRDRSAARLDERLRTETTPPVVARIQDDAVVLDLRTVDEADDGRLTAAIRAAARESS